jgi:hypothetical protein
VSCYISQLYLCIFSLFDRFLSVFSVHYYSFLISPLYIFDSFTSLPFLFGVFGQVDARVPDLARQSAGFSGADLTSLVREAAVRALRCDPRAATVV